MNNKTTKSVRNPPHEWKIEEDNIIIERMANAVPYSKIAAELHVSVPQLKNRLKYLKEENKVAPSTTGIGTLHFI